MSMGEDRVRVKFNPVQDDVVFQIKQKSAELIDYVATVVNSRTLQGPRWHKESCFIKALDAYEEAAMWAVKAATA